MKKQYHKIQKLLLPLLAVSSFGLEAAEVKTADKAERPNIILLLTDDQSYHSVGYSGNHQVKTPNIDALAERGVIFDRAYDTTSICMASRAQVFTGMYEYKTGANFTHGPLAPEKWQQSYQVLLRDAGYFTGFVGKFGFAVKDVEKGSSYKKDDDLPINDFDVWYGWPSQGNYATAKNKSVAKFAKQYPHTTKAVGAASIDFIEQAKKTDKPFLLSVSFKAPHKAFTPDPAYDHVYADTVWEEPKNFGENGAKHIPEQAKGGRQYRTMKDFVPEKFQTNMRKYHQLVYGVDQAVGMITEALEQQGLSDNTVILFLSDNGYSLGAHNMSGKVLPYEEPSRTPMVVYDPRLPSLGKNNRVQSVTSNLDMAPTIFELSGVKTPSNVDGKSLLPLLKNPDQKVQDNVMLINAWGSSPTHSLTVVTDKYKYIYWPFSHGMEPAEELYDLSKDQHEMVNQLNNPEYAKQLKMMREKFDAGVVKWQTETVSTGNYPAFGKMFDRSLAWEEKLSHLDSRMQRKYVDWQASEKSEKDKSKKNKDKNRKNKKDKKNKNSKSTSIETK
ncbi:sulfatase [Thalassotalea crassostreae]|nr:sulfatase [Thalassotalea crassostreae]